MNYTILVLMIYTAMMLFSTVLLTRKEKNVIGFCVGNRNIGWIVSALSIAATWIWAPALFTSTEIAYTKGFAGLFWFLVPNVLCLILFIPFAKKIRQEMPEGITLTGIRTAESVQRLQNIATMLRAGKTMSNRQQVFPIYDWRNNDVWLYLLCEKVDIPEIYLFLWQSGARKGQLRVSQFFSIDTAKSLVKMNEYYPDLMERIVRREPNAYLASLYWDSEMFGRNTSTRKENEKGSAEKDYKAALLELFSNMDGNFTTEHKRYIAERYRNFFMSVSTIADNKDCKVIYEGLMSGDPKLRTYRALYQRIYGKYFEAAKRKEALRNG